MNQIYLILIAKYDLINRIDIHDTILLNICFKIDL